MAESITKTGLKKLITLRNFLIYKRYHLLAQFNQKKFTLNPQAHFVTSIASYPKRSHLLPAVFEALSRQTVKPRKMIMVLSEEEWPGLVVPSYIKKLIDRGVEIIWAKNNTYAVKKLVPVIEKYPDLAVITLDDDIIYHPSLIYSLIENKYTAERCIVGHVGKILVRKGNSLNMMYRVNKNASISTPPEQVYLIGWGGIYYPQKSLDCKVLNLEAISHIVPGRGSDIWFWASAVAQETKQICLGIPKSYKLGIPIPQNKQTLPKDRPGVNELEERFQKTIDYFGIRKKLLAELPDISETIKKIDDNYFGIP